MDHLEYKPIITYTAIVVTAMRVDVYTRIELI